MCDFDVTRPPDTPPPFLSRDDLAFDDVEGLLVKLSELVFSVESLEAFSLLVSFGFEVVLEDLESSSAVGILISFSDMSCTTSSSFSSELFVLAFTQLSIAAVAVCNDARSSLV